LSFSLQSKKPEVLISNKYFNISIGKTNSSST